MGSASSITGVDGTSCFLAGNHIQSTPACQCKFSKTSRAVLFQNVHPAVKVPYPPQLVEPVLPPFARCSDHFFLFAISKPPRQTRKAEPYGPLSIYILSYTIYYTTAFQEYVKQEILIFVGLLLLFSFNLSLFSAQKV